MKEKCNRVRVLVIFGFILAIVIGMSSTAAAEGLPKTFGVTAYGTTSSGYAAMVAIGNAISEDGYKMRVLPAKNDISRMTPLKGLTINNLNNSMKLISEFCSSIHHEICLLSDLLSSYQHQKL